MACFRKRNGKWTVRFYVNGKQKRLSGFLTKKEAEQGYFKYINSPNHPSNKITFSEVVYNYIKLKENEYKLSTLMFFKRFAERHLIPYFGNKKFQNITKEDLMLWKIEMLKRKYSIHTLSNMFNCLKTIYDFAFKTYDFKNLMLYIDKFKNTNPIKQKTVWSLDDFYNFIEAVRELKYKVFFSFLFITGLRRGEALALSWSDIDFENSLVAVNKTCDFSTSTFKVLERPKNAFSNRVVYIPNELLYMLELLKEDTIGDFVFNGKKPFSPSIIYKVIHKYSKLASVPYINIHAFRHSNASILYNNGFNIKVISRRLGHSNIERTLKTYVHTDDEKQKDLLYVFDKIRS